MKTHRYLAGLIWLATTATGQAGSILFDPPALTIQAGTQSVSFMTQAVPEQLTTFEAVNFVFGSREGLGLSFLVHPDLIYLGLPPGPPFDFGIYSALTNGVGRDLAYGCSNYSSAPWTLVNLGTLTIDTSGLQPGDVRQILVDPELEKEYFGDPATYVSSLVHGTTQEPLAGMVTITVVPEPSTALILLILGGIGLASRRGVDP